MFDPSKKLNSQDKGGPTLDLGVSEKDKGWEGEGYAFSQRKFDVTEKDHLKVTGELTFDATLKGRRIADSYHIEIVFARSRFSLLPQVRGLDSRIKTSAESRNEKLENIHVSPKEGTACLCIDIPEVELGYFPNGFDLQVFFKELVIPFFYAQSYFEKHGTWPWPTASHGICGLLEWYLEQGEMSRERIEGFISHLKKRKEYWELIREHLIEGKEFKKHHKPCLCGNPVRFDKCHNGALIGIRKLVRDVKDNRISV